MPNTVTSPTPSRVLPRAVDARPILPRAAAAAALALVLNLVIAAATVALLDVPDGYDPLAPLSVAAATLVGVAAATALLAVLRRRSDRWRQWFGVLVGVGTLLSLGGPLSLLQEPQQYPQATGAVVAATASLHLVTAAVVLAVLPRRGRSS